jgi:hypothetical protein
VIPLTPPGWRTGGIVSWGRWGGRGVAPSEYGDSLYILDQGHGIQALRESGYGCGVAAGFADRFFSGVKGNMWLSGFALIPLQFIAICSSLLGFPFLLVAWTYVASPQGKNARGRIPTALYAFTVSVLLNMIGVVFGFTIAHDLPDDRPGMWLKECAFPLFLVAAFVFLIISMVLMHRDSWQGKKNLQVGSKGLFIIAMLGFIWFSVG